MLFGMKVIRPEKLDSFYDITTLLMKWVIRDKLRRNPDLRLLEIGAGTFAVLSGCLARYARRPIEAVEIDPKRAASSQKHIDLNRVNVKLAVSDIFANAPKQPFDIVFWNLPYYDDPTLLHRLFSHAPEFLNPAGELILGYNSKPLPRATITSILDEYPRLRLSHVHTWRWNMHDVLIVRHADAPAKLL